MHEIFIQTDEQRAILDTVARFVNDEVTPRAAELDAAGAGGQGTHKADHARVTSSLENPLPRATAPPGEESCR